MLAGSQPRGLPGTTIKRIELQRASEGHPLDDVIVHAHDSQGEQAVLAIQVKRSITFAPSDPVFRAVVGQIADTSRQIDLNNERYEFAIAIARTSRQIDGAYQDVLAWARDLGSAQGFMERIERAGAANDDMRRFVQTFRGHLSDFGVSADDDMVWSLLRGLQILTFDYTAPGSASEELAKERAVGVLNPDESHRASTLWATLIESALSIASHGGERTRDQLLEDLRTQSFRFAGMRRFVSARAALSEAAEHALAEINDHVGDAVLARHQHLGAVRAALDQHRYVEIRGEAGVGKSAVLKHLALQVAKESQVIVFAPDRTAPRGWFALRGVLGFDGTARELLADLAADGGAVLFIDNLDNFNEQEQKTVSDIVLEAAKVPGFAVVATARHSFGKDEPSWLPSDALRQLGSAAPVIIGELSESEVDELKITAPALAALLSNTHPAREVTRNLYRLGRLFSLGSNEPAVRTEIEMAEQWWQTADGRRDEGYRERARLLVFLANQALHRAQPLSTVDQPTQAIDALVRSETLRDLGDDRVAFWHDVLREWAIANVLFSDSTALGRLPLERPASASLARGLELATRIAIEHTQDAARWNSLLSAVSGEGVHLSWRRAVLLAPVRSEAASALLERVAESLLVDRAALLCELIRTVMAVDVSPMSDRLLAAGLDPAIVPKGIKVPNGPSWYRLILWLLNLGVNIPGAAVPDVVELYCGWCTLGIIGKDALTPVLVRWLYHWLLEIETAHDAGDPRVRREPFGGQVQSHQLRILTQELRAYFLVFCNHAPDLAAHYLQLLMQRRSDDESVKSVLSTRSALAQAAPRELADLTAATLIPKEPRAQRHERYEEPFEYVDHIFIPASPAQGPFYELLIHATQIGLALIRQLTDHAITFYSKGRAPGTDLIRVSFSDGERIFPWKTSYGWSRQGVGHSCVTSALMALEAWGHSRIDSGASISEVLSQVLGTGEVPAAYLLVAVDLILSHWDKARESAIPFLACPELLCIDRERQMFDESPDLLGFGSLQKEPIGVATLEGLKKRASRRSSLDALLANYAVDDARDLQPALADSLRLAQVRLGAPEADSDLGHPAFMVLHALNLSDPGNWREVPVKLRDGSLGTAFQYVPPPAEIRHLKPLQEADQPRQTDANIVSRLSLALEDSSRSSAELAATGVAWARQASDAVSNTDRDENWMRSQAVYAAALIAARDGGEELRAQHEAWIRETFTQALQLKDDPVHAMRPGIRYNPIAIAFVGLAHLLKHRVDEASLREVLEIAGRENPAGARGLAAVASQLTQIDSRLPCALVRCALAACVRPVGEWDATDEDRAVLKSRFAAKMSVAVNAELAWLLNNGSEPQWPAFTLERVRSRRRSRIQDESSAEESVELPNHDDERVFHQSASLWLGAAATLTVADAPWLCDIVKSYSSWSLKSNGVGRPREDDISNAPDEWNGVYFDLLAACWPLLPGHERKSKMTAITQLPDEPFFDILPTFVRALDMAYFGTQSLEADDAVEARTELTDRLMDSWGWRRLSGRTDDSIEWHIGPAIAVLLFNDFLRPFPPKCYLYPPAMDRVGPFMPLIERLNRAGPCFFVATFTLNLLEVSPKWSHLSLILNAADAWLKKYADNTTFWLSRSIGQRVCHLIERAVGGNRSALDPDPPLRAQLDGLLAALVRLGVSEASALERAMSI
jgi:hypothetical protein